MRCCLLFLLLAGCKPVSEYPIEGVNGGRFRLLQSAEEPTGDGSLGRIAAFAREGDDTRWIESSPGSRYFKDTHIPIR